MIDMLFHFIIDWFMSGSTKRSNRRAREKQKVQPEWVISLFWCATSLVKMLSHAERFF